MKARDGESGVPGGRPNEEDAMNDCEQAIRLNAYHDGEMTPAVRTEFEEHLRHCSQCSAELARILEMTRILGMLSPPGMRSGSLERLHRKVDQLAGAGIRRMAEALSAVAAAVLVACLVGLSWQPAAPSSSRAMPLWEAAAVAQEPVEPSAGGMDELLAQWVVRDLNGKDKHE